MTGLETELSVAITHLINNKILGWTELVRKISLNPSRLLGIDKGTLGVGKDADITVIDFNKEWVVKKEEFLSKSGNSAFLGNKLQGLVEYTICAGKVYKWNS